MTQYQKVLLNNVDKVEFGAVESGAFNIAFGRNQTRNEHSMRIWYRMPSEGGWLMDVRGHLDWRTHRKMYHE